MGPGSRVGVYEIGASIGAGGMGEVFRARDTRLGRDVAIKFLPDLFVNDPDRLARFEREARALAALNHPHIAQIYGIEESAGVRALVMELVEGPTLADRLAAGPIAIAETIHIARQMADALECAHERGIVHRDLKPANVKVREDGTVKVLDFGLAKASEPSGSGSGPLANSPTFTSPAMTERGLIIGTAAYMAPEQARGKVVDHRADIWAFGVIVFEMVTGRQMFAGETVSDTLAAVLREEIAWTTLPPLPPALRRMLERCLQKDPKRRLHSIADARLDLDEAVAAPAAGVALPAATVSPWPARLGWMAAIILAVVAAIAIWSARHACKPTHRAGSSSRRSPTSRGRRAGPRCRPTASRSPTPAPRAARPTSTSSASAGAILPSSPAIPTSTSRDRRSRPTARRSPSTSRAATAGSS